MELRHWGGATDRWEAPAQSRSDDRQSSQLLRLGCGIDLTNTTGGEGSALNGGWWNDGAYGSVTVSRAAPSLLYIHVTTPHRRAAPCACPIMDTGSRRSWTLRSGNPVAFTDSGVLSIKDHDWSDVERFGDKVFKINLAGNPLVGERWA